MAITLNNDRKLFVIDNGRSVSCLGFNVVFAYAKELARRLCGMGKDVSTPTEEQIGTMSQYTQYNTLLSDYIKLDDDKTWFDERTPEKAQKALESARFTGNTVRIFYGNAETGYDWLEENDTIGRVSRSTGALKTPLLVPSKSDCGSAILTDSIVRIIDMTTGRDLYRHPKYQTPVLRVVHNPKHKQLCYEVEAFKPTGEYEIHARFGCAVKAAAFIDFLKGTIHRMPR